MIDWSKWEADRDDYPRKVLDTDKCDWCRDKKATITDGTYVYCSEKCKELFMDNVQEAIEEASNSNKGNKI